MLFLKNPLTLLLRRTRLHIATAIRNPLLPLSRTWIVVDLLVGMFNVVLADYGAYDAAVAGGRGFNNFDAHLGL
jgi:hypothetical protein